MVSLICNTNVFGACAHSGLLYFMTDHGHRNDFWVLYQDIALLVISVLIQFSFIFWVWESIDLQNAQQSCSVHPVAKLSSVAVLATSSFGANAIMRIAFKNYPLCRKIKHTERWSSKQAEGYPVLDVAVNAGVPDCCHL